MIFVRSRHRSQSFGSRLMLLIRCRYDEANEVAIVDDLDPDRGTRNIDVALNAMQPVEQCEARQP